MKTMMKMTRGEQPTRHIIDQRTDTDMRTGLRQIGFIASGVHTQRDIDTHNQVI